MTLEEDSQGSSVKALLPIQLGVCIIFICAIETVAIVDVQEMAYNTVCSLEWLIIKILMYVCKYVCMCMFSLSNDEN